MSDVDYSEFYYQRPSIDPEPPREKYHREGKKRKFSTLISTILIIILIFGIAFFCADFFMKGELISKVGSLVRGNDYEYYLVVGDCDSRDKAYAQSLLVKQGGGSGYIISGEKFSVIYSPFTDRSEANAVCQKNENTYVYVVEFYSKDVDFYNSFFNEIDILIRSVADFEKGNKTDSEIFSDFNYSKERLSAIRSDDLSKEKQDLIDYAVGSIEGLDFAKGAKTSFLSDARYVLSGIIISLQKTA